jgi:hypothetical protein
VQLLLLLYLLLHCAASPATLSLVVQLLLQRYFL